MKVALLPIEDRPREKALKKGLASLTDSELLALIIGKGRKGENALELSSRLIFEYGSINNLKNIEYADLIGFKGLGEAKSLSILSIFELNKRISSHSYIDLDYFKAIERIKASDYGKECHLLCLDKKEKLLRDFKFAFSPSSNIAISGSNLAKIATRAGSAKAVLIHTHLSFYPYPSKEDIKTTLTLKQIFSRFEIDFIDSIIIGKKGLFSFKSEGML